MTTPAEADAVVTALEATQSQLSAARDAVDLATGAGAPGDPYATQMLVVAGILTQMAQVTATLAVAATLACQADL